MRITLGELQSSLPALQELASNKFPARVAYRLGRILKAAESEVQHLREAHFALVKQLGEQGEGDNWKVKPEHLEQFQREMAELLAEECDLWGSPLDVSALGDAQLEPQLLAVLTWLITDDEHTDVPQLVNGKAQAEAAM